MLQENEIILATIQNYLKNNPNIRFIQALWNLGIITAENSVTGGLVIEDRYNEKSSTTLDRMKILREETLAGFFVFRMKIN